MNSDERKGASIWLIGEDLDWSLTSESTQKKPTAVRILKHMKLPYEHPSTLAPAPFTYT